MSKQVINTLKAKRERIIEQINELPAGTTAQEVKDLAIAAGAQLDGKANQSDTRFDNNQKQIGWISFLVVSTGKKTGGQFSLGFEAYRHPDEKWVAQIPRHERNTVKH